MEVCRSVSTFSVLVFFPLARWRKQVIWLDFEPIRHHHIRFLLRCLHDCSFIKQASCTISRFNTRTEDKPAKMRRISLAVSYISGNPSTVYTYECGRCKRHTRDGMGVRPFTVEATENTETVSWLPKMSKLTNALNYAFLLLFISLA